MYLLLYFCIILFIPHLSGKNLLTETTNIIDHNTHSNNSSSVTQKEDSAITNVTLNTEGGSVKPELPPISLPKESHPDLTNFDKEIIGKSKGKSVVPRKGVHYDSVEDNPTNINNLNHTKERIDSTIVDSKPINDKVIAASVQPSTSKSSTKPPSSAAEVTKDIKASTPQSSIPAVPKKPLVLSSEAISETDRRVQMEKAKTESSSKTVVSDQLPSPSMKYEPATHSSHPDMVMPIVITMLVVPMFAVLGYMALRRGQEAWKNRHYKRMDFLLDGMYND